MTRSSRRLFALTLMTASLRFGAVGPAAADLPGPSGGQPHRPIPVTTDDTARWPATTGLLVAAGGLVIVAAAWAARRRRAAAAP